MLTIASHMSELTEEILNYHRDEDYKIVPLREDLISAQQEAGLDLIRHRINVNAIAPGVVDGEHWDHVDSLFAKYENRPKGEKKRLVGESVPYGRMGRAEDLTGMAVFLASDEAEYIVAQTYNVDGGQWMS